jgi:hypothetical protein
MADSTSPWELIDHVLVNSKLTDLAEVMLDDIAADEIQIRFDNRNNQNRETTLLLEMHERRIAELVEKTYQIYCEVWEKQGYGKTADFVRAISSNVIEGVIKGRARGVVGNFSRAQIRTNAPAEPLGKRMASFQQKMERLLARWRRQLEIEARECEYATRARRSAVATSVPTTQEGADAGLDSAGSGKNIGGRRPRLDSAFVGFAGTLWLDARGESGQGRVTTEQLGSVAANLDERGYVPPAEYLEKSYASEIRIFNSRNSNSRIGPIKTWVQLVSLSDKDHLRGMRKLLSRCAEKIKSSTPTLSGN